MTFVFSESRRMKARISLLILTVLCLGSMTFAEKLTKEAIPIDSLKPVEISKERLSAFEYAPVVELEEQVSINEDGITEHVWNSRSPFTINDMTIEEHETSMSIENKLNFRFDEEGNPRRGLYNTTE